MTALLLTLSIGLILLFAGVFVYIWRWVNRRWVQHNGQEVQAHIVRVSSRQRGDWGTVWEVHAQWQREQDGKVFAFSRGMWLCKDPAPYLQAQGIQTVAVRIDPQYPRAHWVVLEFLPPEYHYKKGTLDLS